MKKLLITSAVATLCATVAFAEGHSAADNGSKGKGKGREAIATAVSEGGAFEKGGANVASTIDNGWGQAGRVANGPKGYDEEPED